MRNIKFRVWNKNRKMFIIDGMTPKEIQDDAMQSAELPMMTDEDCVWQQYTGLKDKNDQEIYEGDIVRVTYERGDIVETSYIGEVEFGDCCLSYTSEAPQHGSMGFYLKTEIQDEPQIGLFQDHNLIGGVAYNEVIGNIFEGVDK